MSGPPPIPPRPDGFGYQPRPGGSTAPPGPGRGGDGRNPSETLDGLAGLTDDLQGIRITPLPSVHEHASAKSTAGQGGRAIHATECVGIPVSFPMTWYTHSTVPDYTICSWCYEKRIRMSPFQSDFKGALMRDGRGRLCAFSRPRMSECIFPEAVSSGSLVQLLQFISFRVGLSECRGSDGVKGSNLRVKWYKPTNNSIPPMVVCQSCYEDYVLAKHLSTHFAPYVDQPPDAVWSCDMAVPHIRNAYSRCAQADDWPQFVREATIRLSLPPCPKTAAVKPDGRQWFEPINGPHGFLICSPCYSDSIHRTSEETKWRDAAKTLDKLKVSEISCDFGQLTMATAANRIFQETHDYEAFWAAARIFAEGPPCDPNGTTNTTWYTLKTDPDHLCICRVCYATVLEPWGIGRFFKIKSSIPKSAKYICCLSTGMSRLGVYIQKTLELMLTGDPAPLHQFASEYGAIPICKRDNDFKNGSWYGWGNCTICPECYHDFVRGTALAESMPLRGGRSERWTMCEMYSPRMRRLYLEACAKNPPDPTELLAYSSQRRTIYAATMIKARDLKNQQQIQVLQHQNLLNQSLHNSWMGSQLAVSLPGHTFGMAPGLEWKYDNQFEVDGAKYAYQAAALSDSITSGSLSGTAQQLERRWREVE